MPAPTSLLPILSELSRRPRSPAELAGLTGMPLGVLSGMLSTLERGGYIQQAQAGAGECACGGCSLKSLCSNADEEAPPATLLRLTERGAAYLMSRGS